MGFSLAPIWPPPERNTAAYDQGEDQEILARTRTRADADAHRTPDPRRHKSTRACRQSRAATRPFASTLSLSHPSSFALSLARCSSLTSADRAACSCSIASSSAASAALNLPKCTGNVRASCRDDTVVQAGAGREASAPRLAEIGSASIFAYAARILHARFFAPVAAELDALQVAVFLLEFVPFCRVVGLRGGVGGVSTQRPAGEARACSTHAHAGPHAGTHHGHACMCTDALRIARAPARLGVLAHTRHKPHATHNRGRTGTRTHAPGSRGADGTPCLALLPHEVVRGHEPRLKKARESRLEYFFRAGGRHLRAVRMPRRKTSARGVRAALPPVYFVYLCALFAAAGLGSSTRESVLLTEWWMLSDGSEVEEPWRLTRPSSGTACHCCAEPDAQMLVQRGSPSHQPWAHASSWHGAGRLLWAAGCSSDPDALVCCKRMALRCFLVAARLLSPHQSAEPRPREHAQMLQDGSVATALLASGGALSAAKLHVALGGAMSAARLAPGEGSGWSRGAVLNVASMLALSSRAGQALAVLRTFLAHSCGRRVASAAEGQEDEGGGGPCGQIVDGQQLEVFKRLWFAGQMTTLGWDTRRVEYQILSQLLARDHKGSATFLSPWVRLRHAHAHASSLARTQARTHACTHARTHEMLRA